MSYEGVDPQSGEQRAIFDLVWPEGLQVGLSQPVAVLLNDDVGTTTIAGGAGFRSFKRYVKAEVPGEAVHA